MSRKLKVRFPPVADFTHCWQKSGMSLRLLLMALAAIFATATAAGQRSAVEENADGISARHLARLRSVFREAHASEVVLSAIVYSSNYPEHVVGLRRAGDSFEVFALWPSQRIWEYAQVEMLRFRVVTFGTLKKGGGIDDRSDEEADRLASALPPNPLDLQLSRCRVEAETQLAESIRAVWQNLLLQLPAEEPTGSAGIYDVYLARAGTEEREMVNSQWTTGNDTPDRHLIELADSMYLFCQSGDAEGSGILEILANRRNR